MAESETRDESPEEEFDDEAERLDMLEDEELNCSEDYVAINDTVEAFHDGSWG